MEFDAYLTISGVAEGLFKDRGSRFIAFAIPIDSADDVKEKVQLLRKDYHDARHICYAYNIGLVSDEYRENDDGEPSGTAGKPIRGVLLKHNITNVAVFVVRYFGGVKLGTSGLINAYRNAALDAITNSTIIEKTIDSYYVINFPYIAMNDVMRILKEKECDILEQSFDNACLISFKLRKSAAVTIENSLLKIENVKLKLLKNK